MQILALETDVEVLKKKFLVEGEQAVLVTHKHWIVFIVNIWWQTIVTTLLLAGSVAMAVSDLLTLPLIASIVGIWGLLYAYYLLWAYVQWKYNFLIISTQKLVIVEQYAVVRQHINPLPFPRISNTRVESQFAGIFRCGILYLNMMVPERRGEYMELSIPYLPKPADIAAMIENGLTINKEPPQPKEEQEKKVLMQQHMIESGNPQPETLREEQPAQAAPDSAQAIGQIIAAGPPPPPNEDSSRQE